MFIGVNGIQLFYTKTGQGRPLIMVHGNSEDHTIFDEAIGVLKEHFTCYAIDSRGHGKSSPCRELHYKDMAADMIAFMTELDLTDVAFYGFSDGGIVGLLAAMDSARITNLIVSGANISTKGTKLGFRLLLMGMSIGKRDPLIELTDRADAEGTGYSACAAVCYPGADSCACGKQGPDPRIRDQADRGEYSGCAPADPQGRKPRQLYRAQH